VAPRNAQPCPEGGFGSVVERTVDDQLHGPANQLGAAPGHDVG